MAKKPQPASPVCYLPEVPDVYAGYLASEEIRSLICQWIARAPRPDIAALLIALLPEALSQEPAQKAPATAPVGGASATEIPLQVDIRRALPRIRDDEMHRALARIADLIGDIKSE